VLGLSVSNAIHIVNRNLSLSRRARDRNCVIALDTNVDSVMLHELTNKMIAIIDNVALGRVSIRRQPWRNIATVGGLRK
jgi:hypothetical protein